MTEQIDIPQSLASAEGLTFDEGLLVSKLTSIWLEHVASNRRNESFYEGTYPIEPLGIAIDPKKASVFEERVDWLPFHGSGAGLPTTTSPTPMREPSQAPSPIPAPLPP